MRNYPEADRNIAPAPEENEENAGNAGQRMSRRMLIAGGGLLLGIAVTVGCGNSDLARETLDQARGHADRRSLTGTATGDRSRTRVASHVTSGKTRHAARTRRPRAADGVTPARPVYYVDDGPKVIALTIDDGPSPVYTPQVLELLARYRVTAAFSMIGENVRSYPGIAREVADAGHVIVNHTWDHANLTRLNAAQVRAEIDGASGAIHSATGASPRMLRAPYGAWSRDVLEYCTGAGITPLDWSVDPHDWSRPGVAEIIGSILRTTRTGSIILEHDGGGNRSQTVAALKVVIPRLLEEGYRFRTPQPHNPA